MLVFFLFALASHMSILIRHQTITGVLCTLIGVITTTAVSVTTADVVRREYVGQNNDDDEAHGQRGRQTNRETWGCTADQVVSHDEFKNDQVFSSDGHQSTATATIDTRENETE